MALQPTLSPCSAARCAVADPTGRGLTRPSGGSDPRGCKAVLLRESQVQPLLLVFEDLHWIDGETQALLDAWWRACHRAAAPARGLSPGI